MNQFDRWRMSRRLIATAAVCLMTLGGGVRPAQAQGAYYVEAAGDYSTVEIGTAGQRWKTARLSGGFFEDGRAGWSVNVERQQRDRLTDWGSSLRGFRRNGPWTFSGAVGIGADPSFSYRRSLEGEIARTVVRTLVAHGGYRHLTFESAAVHLVQPAATLYLPRGDVGVRYFMVRNTTRATTTGTVLVQGTVTVHRRLRLGGGGAFGERIFDVAALATPSAASWVGFGFAHVTVSRQWTVDIGTGRAHEDPLFSQGTFTIGVRRTFGALP